MKKFMGKNFLLTTDTARMLYHEYAKNLPIIDYHCHVSPKEIAEDKHYSNITELWLGGDHYKWRAIRSCGVPEEYITGSASDYDKFRAFAEVMPRLIGNPLYHWSHLELRRYFGYKGVLNADTCDEVWALCNKKLAEPDMSVRQIILKSGVEVICTTDDPCDTLEYHEQIAADDSFPVRVLPAFRPDKGINIERKDYRDYLKRLESASGIAITDLDSLKAAFRARLDFFAAHGCCNADHGIDEVIPFAAAHGVEEPAAVFAKYLAGEKLDEREIRVFKTEMHRFFGGEYKKRSWVMQIHFAVLRNPSETMLSTLGPDTGYDVIGGRVTIEETKRNVMCNLTITADDGEVVTYALPYAAGIKVKHGDMVEKGIELTEGALSPHEVLRIRGLSACHNYLIREVQKVYRQQGVDTNDKHIEVIVRQMMRKVRVEDAGDSDLLSGATVDIIEFLDAEEAVKARIAAGEKNEMGEELRVPTCTRLLMGITKASLATESFLSAASFQETTKVLTEAAIKGKVDHLLGLKENVIIGKLIPAGAGLGAYRELAEELVPDPDPVEEETAPQEVIFTNQVAAANVE